MLLNIFAWLYNHLHHPSPELSFSCSPANTLYPVNADSPHSSSPLPPPQSPFSFLFLYIWVFLVPHVSGIIQCLLFCDQHTSLNIMSSRLIHVGSCVRISFSFFFLAKSQGMWSLSSQPGLEPMPPSSGSTES